MKYSFLHSCLLFSCYLAMQQYALFRVLDIICILMGLKEELAWTTDKLLWVIRNEILFRTVIALRN